MKKRTQKASRTEQLGSLIIKDFSLDKDSDVATACSDKELLYALERVVNYLLDKDFNRLLNILYRIDVDEQLVKQIFASDEPVAQGLSKAILARQKGKVQYRATYGKSN